MATVAQLNVVITANAAGLTSTVAKTNSSLNTLGGTATKTGGILGKLGASGTAIKAGLGIAVIGATKALFDMGAESMKVNAQTVAGLKSTGGAANVTLAQIQGLATGVQNYSGIGDEAVQTGENMLLTFTNIQNQAGKNNDIFNQTTTAVADMATKMNGGATPAAEQMQQTALQLGKALNDPIKGMGALSRVGVQFTASQKAQITALVETGDTLGAQKIILAEVTKEFGGSAKALGSTFTGQFNIIKETVGNALEGVVVGLMKILGPVAQVVGWVLKLASASGLLTPLVAIVLAFAIAWGIYTIAQNAAAIAAWEFLAPWLPLIAIVAVFVAVIIGVVKLVQAGLSALSGGWSKMGGIMKAVLIATAPLWVPIVVAIKIVQAILAALGAVVSFVFDHWQGILVTLAVLFFPITIAIALVVVAFNILKAIAIAVFNAIVSALTPVASFIAAAWQAVGTAFAAVWNTAITIFNGFVNGIITGINFVIGVINVLITAFNKIPFHADVPLIGTLDKLGGAAAGAAPKVAAVGNAAQQSGQKMAGFQQVAFKTADVMSAAWGNVGPKVAGSLKQITKAITQSLQAELHLQKNTQTVTNRLVQDYGLTADQAARSLADASPKAMATMAKASDKEFGKTGKAIQQVNHIIPSVVKGQTDLGNKVAATSKAVGDGSKSNDDLAKSATDVGKTSASASKGTSSLGNSVQSSAGKVQTMTSNVAKLSSELNGLPDNITIQVTVNVTKTGQQLGGVVPGLVRGGMARSPLTMVGETGKELAALPAGTHVFSHGETMGMLAAAGGGGGRQGPMMIRGKLSLVGGEAFIEGVVEDMLDDGSFVDDVLTRAMGRP